MSVLKVKNGDQWDIVPAIKGDTGDPAADESITDAMLVPDGIKTEIDWLWGNQLMDIREGELLQTDDAYEAPLVSLDVDGNSTQVVTTGKNLLNPDTYQSPWTEFYLSSTWDGTVVESGSNYKLGFIIEVPSGGSVTYSCAIRITFHLAWIDGPIEIGSTVSGVISTENRYTFTSTNSTDVTKYLLVYFNYSGRTSTQKDTIINDKVQIERGSDATAYEPYTGLAASPRPDWPQEIVSIDEPSATLAAKNIYGGEALRATIAALSGAVSGTDSYGSYVKVGSGALSNQILYKCPFKPNTQYTLIQRLAKASGNTSANIQVKYTNGTYEYIYLPTGFTANVPYTIVTVTAAGKTVERIVGVNSSVVTVFYYDSCGVFEGVLTVDDYEPYLGSTVPLLPDGYSLRSLPNGTKDELHLSYLRPSAREGWAWYDRELVERTQEVVINSGLSQFQANSANHNRVRKKISGSLAGVNHSKCNRFIYNSSTYNYGVPGDYYISAEYAYFIVPDSITTLEEANAWVSDNPIQMVTDKSVATVSIDPIELPIMPSKDTTIWSDPSAQLKMTYIQDTNLVIESLEATVADMATS